MDFKSAIDTLGVAAVLAGFAGQWAVQRSNLAQVREDIKTLRTVLDNHIQRTDIHVDPVRDQQRWSDLMRVLDRMDRRLDRLVHPSSKDSETND